MPPLRFGGFARIDDPAPSSLCKNEAALSGAYIDLKWLIIAEVSWNGRFFLDRILRNDDVGIVGCDASHDPSLPAKDSREEPARVGVVHFVFDEA